MKREMEAYIVLLHLVSQGWATFRDIQDILGWKTWKQAVAINIVAYINSKLPELSEEWGEEIPQINVFMFNLDGECTSYVCEKIFGRDEGEQPSPRQIAEYAKKIATYENWDKVLEVFRKDAFSD